TYASPDRRHRFRRIRVSWPDHSDLFEDIDQSRGRLGALAEDGHRTLLDLRQLEPDAWVAGAGFGGVVFDDRRLLRLHPSGDRGVARVDPALLDGDDGRQIEGEDLGSGRSDPAGFEAVGTRRERLDVRQHRIPEVVGQSNADLEVAGIGRVIAQQHEVEGLPRLGAVADDV